MVEAGFALVVAGVAAIAAFLFGARVRSSDIDGAIDGARAEAKESNDEAREALDEEVQAMRAEVEKVHDRNELARMLDE